LITVAIRSWIPNIARKAIGLSATPQHLGQARALLLRQLGRRAGTGAISQRVRSTRSSTGNPLADHRLGHAQRDGDLLLRSALS